MTPTETFLKEHHANWQTVRETKMFKDLMGLMDAISPAKQLPTDINLLFNAAPVLVNQIGGWERAHNFIKTLGDRADEQAEPQSNYAEPMRVVE